MHYMTNMATPLPNKIYNFGKYFIAYNYDEYYNTRQFITWGRNFEGKDNP